MKSKKIPNGPLRIYTRHFTDYNVEEFKYLIQEESWNEVFECEEPNNSFKQFMNTFTYYFNTAFPIKVKLGKNFIENKWITKGLIIFRNKLRLLYNIKRTTSLSIEASKYIQISCKKEFFTLEAESTIIYQFILKVFLMILNNLNLN